MPSKCLQYWQNVSTVGPDASLDVARGRFFPMTVFAPILKLLSPLDSARRLRSSDSAAFSFLVIFTLLFSAPPFFCGVVSCFHDSVAFSLLLILLPSLYYAVPFRFSAALSLSAAPSLSSSCASRFATLALCFFFFFCLFHPSQCF